MQGPSIWWALAGIVLIGVVWESSAPTGGLLLLIIVFGMLFVGEQNHTLAFPTTRPHAGSIFQGTGASGTF